MNEHEVVRALAALAQPVRLRIYRTLVGAAGAGMVPGALCDCLDVSASTLSFHLKELMNAGLVTQERRGRHLIYRPALQSMDAVLAYLTAHCCQGCGCLPPIPELAEPAALQAPAPCGAPVR